MRREEKIEKIRLSLCFWGGLQRVESVFGKGRGVSSEPFPMREKIRRAFTVWFGGLKRVGRHAWQGGGCQENECLRARARCNIGAVPGERRRSYVRGFVAGDGMFISRD